MECIGKRDPKQRLVSECYRPSQRGLGWASLCPLLMVAVRFNLGKVSLTKSIREECKIYPRWTDLIRFLLTRHSRGDWGDLSEEEHEENNSAFSQRVKVGRLLSAYNAPGGKICIITDNPFDDPSTLVFHCSLSPNLYRSLH